MVLSTLECKTLQIYNRICMCSTLPVSWRELSYVLCMSQVHMPNQRKTWMGKALSMIPAHWSASLAKLRQDTHVHHTTQIYFDNTLSQRVYSELSAYSERDLSTPERIAFNEDDCVFRDGGGEAQIAHSSEVNPSSLADGLMARVVLKLDTSLPMPHML